MEQEEKELMFTQMCNAIGFKINPIQARLLLSINTLLDEKGSLTTMNDLNLLVEKVSKEIKEVEKSS